MKESKDYFLGLDIGTSSVGWAVTDESYRLMRAKGKDLWGVRLFQEAETSAKRRTFRVSRRRRQREVARIGLLKEMFSDEIEKVDSSFYQRLQESKYHITDRSTQNKYTVFSDKDYNDRDYFAKYPTIYHLRNELIQSDEPHDVRLVFLAILNLLKHRGHFLNTSLDAEQNMSFKALYDELMNKLYEDFGISFDTAVVGSDVEAILCNRGLSRTRKLEQLISLLNIKKSKDKLQYEIVKAICGLTISIDVIFGEHYIGDDHKKITLSFDSNNYDEIKENVQIALGEDNMVLLDLLKAIHDQSILSKVMQGFKYLSEARVDMYKKHHDDLRLLKRVIKKYASDQYDTLFRFDEDGSYSAYVGSVNSREKLRRSMKNRKRDDLYITLKKILKKCPSDDPQVQLILSNIENEDFLPKQLNSSNGVIPHQVHLEEMKAILNNASKYLDFLQSVDETGLSISEKIISLFNFQIPYYIGPLNNHHSGINGNAWIVRKERGMVLPWNIDALVDTKKTSEAFIERLIRKCTYIKDDSVLPKSSLLYEKFMVLNELNNLRINGDKPCTELKQEIFNRLFTSGKKITQKKLIDFLKANAYISPNTPVVISGIDGDFTNTLSTYSKFVPIFSDKIHDDEVKSIIEKIVFWGTVYGEDKKYYKETLRRELRSILEPNQIERICGYKFKDWGNLSRNFLEMNGINKSTGEVLPLIQMLWQTNDNLMEILSDRYTYTEELTSEYNAIAKSLNEMVYDDLKDLYISTPVRRMVWQTLLIVKELEEILGAPPKRMFIEMARGDGENGKRTFSRKQRLLDLYKNCKIDSKDWCETLQRFDDSSLRSKKLYLYFLQNGRCMYTGEVIDIEKLMNDNLYDIDHIYPRKYVKDDSLENNLVLVKKEVNAHKSDQYPIEESIYRTQHSFWKSLLSKDMKDGFITREKYNRLVERNPLSDEQLVGFINRQLVETRQGTKAIAQILNQAFSNSEVIYVKAKNISEFRHDYDLIKVRSVNDFHHAQDAYLSIVIGNTYHVKFTKNPMNFIKQYRQNGKNSNYHMNKIFHFTVKRGEETAWISETNSKSNSIGLVKAMMSKNSPLITKMTYEGHGELFNATLYSASKSNKESYVPLKTSDIRFQDVQKYGGYSSVTVAHLFLVEHEVKGKKIRTLEALPLIFKDTVGNDISKLNKYCIDSLNLIMPDVRLSKIKLHSLFKRDGFYINITGKTKNQLYASNAVPLVFNRSWVDYIKKIEKAITNNDIYNDISFSQNINLYDELIDKHLNKIFSKRPNPIGKLLLEGKRSFENLEPLDQCKVINQILQTTQLSNLGANLVLIKGSKESGISKISKNVSSASEFILVNQSVTGLICTETDLLTV